MSDQESGVDRRTVLATGAALLTPAAAEAKPSDIVMLGAADLSRAIAGRAVSCAEVMTAHLDHIARLNPKVNAIVALQDRDALMAQARLRDAQLAHGESMGPLHGFPHAVKDLLPVKGIVSTSGSPLLKDFVPQQDALPVERMRKAGAIFIGKTNVPEFGLGSQSYNPVYGVTHNAYDQRLTSGGSSGGAAVSLALRMTPLADGTDYGGSLRNPAGWNGVYGFRTSFGIVPVTGEDVWLPSMSVAGPMARGVDDLALLLSVMAGHDARAPLSVEGEGRRFLASLDGDMKGRRIAWLGDMKGWAPHEPGVLEVCRAALKTFEAVGCTIDEAQPGMAPEPAWQAFQRIRAWQVGSPLRGYYADPAKRAQLKAEAQWEVEQGAKLSAYDIAAATAVRTAWSNAVARLFDTHDYLVMPTSQVFAFDVNTHWPKEIAGQQMQTYHAWMKALCLITMAGCPSLAVPAGFDAQGRAMGLQIIAPVHHEMDCLRLAKAYEQALPAAAKKLPPLLQV